MRRPQPTDYGTTEQDLLWAQRAQYAIVFASLLVSALGWAAFGLLATKSLSPLLLVRALIVGLCLVSVSTFLVAVPAQIVLYFISARYRQARRYRSAYRKFITAAISAASRAQE